MDSKKGELKVDCDYLKRVALTIQQIKDDAKQSLVEIKKLRKENPATLKKNLSEQREVEELIRQASDEIQKILADIRVIRWSIQEELANSKKG
jgi:hypothetical protein